MEENSQNDPLPDKVWRLCSELNSAIYDAAKGGYRVDIRHDEYGELGIQFRITVVQASISKGITQRDRMINR